MPLKNTKLRGLHKHRESFQTYKRIRRTCVASPNAPRAATYKGNDVSALSSVTRAFCHRGKFPLVTAGFALKTRVSAGLLTFSFQATRKKEKKAALLALSLKWTDRHGVTTIISKPYRKRHSEWHTVHIFQQSGSRRRSAILF